MINDADIDFVMSEIFLQGAQIMGSVCRKPAQSVIISTSGTSLVNHVVY